MRSAYKPYAQARYRNQWQFSAADRMEFRETLFWTTSAGFGSTTAFEYEHAWSPTVALRWLNAATISHGKDDFAWSTSLGLFRRYGDERRLSLEALIWRLFHEEVEVRVEPLAALARGCRCSSEYYEQVLARFSEEDRAEMRSDDGAIEVDCAFCSKVFRIAA